MTETTANIIDVKIGDVVGECQFGRNPIPQFVNLRETALSIFSDSIRTMSKDSTNDGHDVLIGSCDKAINYALSGALREIQTNYFGFAKNAELVTNGDSTHIDLTVRGDLVDSYFAAVNS